MNINAWCVVGGWLGFFIVLLVNTFPEVPWWGWGVLILFLGAFHEHILYVLGLYTKDMTLKECEELKKDHEKWTEELLQR